MSEMPKQRSLPLDASWPLEAITHEVRTPLSVIRMAASTMAGGELSQADHDRLLAMIRRNADLALHLIERLGLAREVAAGSVMLEPAPVDLANVVRETVADLATAMLGDHPVEISGSERAVVEADAVGVREILTNLLLNAAKHSTPGTPITVRLDAGWDERQVAIVVRDRGRGIAARDREHVFDQHFQGPGAEQGLGLGLFISRGLARAHGGELEVRPGEGGGSEFMLRLPWTAPVHPVPNDAATDTVSTLIDLSAMDANT